MDIFRNARSRSYNPMHLLVVEPDRSPVKQTPRTMHPDLATKVEVHVDKLVIVGFIREV